MTYLASNLLLEYVIPPENAIGESERANKIKEHTEVEKVNGLTQSEVASTQMHKRRPFMNFPVLCRNAEFVLRSYH
jgi:hypothetical protein